MSFLAKRRLARNITPLPLFDWAERNAVNAFEPLLITRKLAGRLNISTTVLDAMAAANGFTAREVVND